MQEADSAAELPEHSLSLRKLLQEILEIASADASQVAHMAQRWEATIRASVGTKVPVQAQLPQELTLARNRAQGICSKLKAALAEEGTASVPGSSAAIAKADYERAEAHKQAMRLKCSNAKAAAVSRFNEELMTWHLVRPPQSCRQL